jgi:hypothetical protein
MLRRCAQVHISQLALLDPTSKTPTRVKWTKDPETGEKQRISVQSGEVIPKPYWENKSLPDRMLYEEQDCDTSAGTLEQVTFAPSPMSFEEEVLAALLKEADVEENATQ